MGIAGGAPCSGVIRHRFQNRDIAAPPRCAISRRVASSIAFTQRSRRTAIPRLEETVEVGDILESVGVGDFANVTFAELGVLEVASAPFEATHPNPT